MYTIYVNFICHPGKREAFVERVRQEGILEAIRAEDGCLRYDYYFSEADKNELLLIEAWETKRQQQIHIEIQETNFYVRQTEEQAQQRS